MVRLHTPSLPAEFGWTELWYVNRHGDAAGQAFREDTMFELTFPTPFVLRCTKGK